jgi:hypothetical protein
MNSESEIAQAYRDLRAGKLGPVPRQSRIGQDTRPAGDLRSRIRNVVAHGYGHVDARSVFAAASAGLTDLSDFASEIARWLAARP